MKVGRLLKLANAIEGRAIPDLGFNMGWYFFWGDGTESKEDPLVGDPLSCGSSACIVGWTCFLFGHLGMMITPGNAEEILGLDHPQARKLFYNSTGYLNPAKYCGSITAAEAVAGIRKMARQELERRHAKIMARVAALENAILSLS